MRGSKIVAKCDSTSADRPTNRDAHLIGMQVHLTGRRVSHAVTWICARASLQQSTIRHMGGGRPYLLLLLSAALLVFIENIVYSRHDRAAAFPGRPLLHCRDLPSRAACNGEHKTAFVQITREPDMASAHHRALGVPPRRSSSITLLEKS